MSQYDKILKTYEYFENITINVVLASRQELTCSSAAFSTALNGVCWLRWKLLILIWIKWYMIWIIFKVLDVLWSLD